MEKDLRKTFTVTRGSLIRRFTKAGGDCNTVPVDIVRYGNLECEPSSAWSKNDIELAAKIK